MEYAILAMGEKNDLEIGKKQGHFYSINQVIRVFKIFGKPKRFKLSLPEVEEMLKQYYFVTKLKIWLIVLVLPFNCLLFYEMLKTIHLLLADDDPDDRFFFGKTLGLLSIPTHLTMVEDGQKLMHFFSKNSEQLPDALFLDLNMPRKNGSECLKEIKGDSKLKDLPVIIYSTSLHEDMAELLYKDGAHYYIRKGGLDELKEVLHYILTLMVEKNFTRPPRDKFILSVLKK